MLPSGEERTIEWSEVEEVERGKHKEEDDDEDDDDDEEPSEAPPAAAGPAPGPGVVRLHIEGDEPGVQLYRVLATAMAVGAGGTAYAQAQEIVCTAPCDKIIDGSKGEAFFFAGDGIAASDGKSSSRPLIVEWPSADRGALEAQKNKGLVVVRYVGCEMEVLRQCSGLGSYDYVPVTLKEDRIRIRNADELYASIPVYAAKFEGKLKTAGELNVEMTIVGSFEADQTGLAIDEVEGDCGKASHYISAITTGSFEFTAGASAEVGAGVEVLGAGVGATSRAERELLNRDGYRKACLDATSEDTAPPDGCGALIRVEVVPLAPPKKPKEKPAAGTTRPDAPPPGWGPSPWGPSPFAKGDTSVKPAGTKTATGQEKAGKLLFGFGVGFLTVGVANGIAAVVLSSGLAESCGLAYCHPDESGDVGMYYFTGTVAGIGLISGGAASALGGILWLTAPDPEEDAAATKAKAAEGHVAPLVGPGLVGVEGTF